MNMSFLKFNWFQCVILKRTQSSLENVSLECLLFKEKVKYYSVGLTGATPASILALNFLISSVGLLQQIDQHQEDVGHLKSLRFSNRHNKKKKELFQRKDPGNTNIKKQLILQASINKQSHCPHSFREDRKRHGDYKRISSIVIMMETLGQVIKLSV